MTRVRQLINSGALLRACLLVQYGWSEQEIMDRLQRDWPGYARATYQTVAALALASAANCADITSEYQPQPGETICTVRLPE